MLIFSRSQNFMFSWARLHAHLGKHMIGNRPWHNQEHFMSTHSFYSNSKRWNATRGTETCRLPSFPWEPSRQWALPRHGGEFQNAWMLMKYPMESFATVCWNWVKFCLKTKCLVLRLYSKAEESSKTTWRIPMNFWCSHDWAKPDVEMLFGNWYLLKLEIRGLNELGHWSRQPAVTGRSLGWVLSKKTR